MIRYPDLICKLKTYDADVTNDDGSVSKKTINEQQELLTAFQNIANVSSLWLGGKNYQILTTDEVDKTTYFRAGKAGGCAVNTNHTILVGLFDIATNDKQTAGN